MENNSDCTLHHRTIVREATSACDLLSSSTGLAKVRIKDAMIKGAVWLKRPGQKEQRIRKATSPLLAGDQVELYYDPQVLAMTPPAPRLIAEEKHYSAWYKPATLLTQGTRYGDHCSLLRCVYSLLCIFPHSDFKGFNGRNRLLSPFFMAFPVLTPVDTY